MNPTVPQELQQAVQAYFDVLYHCDLERFDPLFAASCQLQTMREGQHVVMSRQDYRALLAGRTPPAASNATRDDRVVSIDRNGDDCALAKVAVLLAGKQFVDYLSLLKVDGRWQIVSKVYAQHA